MMNEAGFKRYFTVHSRKVTTATTLYQIGVDEQLIKERNGDKTQLGNTNVLDLNSSVFLAKFLTPPTLILERISMPSPVRPR